MFNIDKVTQKILKKFPNRAADIAQSFDDKQYISKRWMLKELQALQRKGMIPNPIPRLFIIGGWYGNIIIPEIDKLLNWEEIRFFDIDEETIEISKMYFKDNPLSSRIKWYCEDATDMEFAGNKNVVINTSGEHMDPLKIESGILAVQSNNYLGVVGHTNCVSNSGQLREQYDWHKVWVEKTHDFTDYERYLVIGRI